MSKQQKLSGELINKGYIFGLGAFRRYREITGHDISHFEEALKPMYKTDDKGDTIFENGDPVRVRDEKVDDVEANYRWATMLKCANDVFCNVNGGEKISLDAFSVLLDNADEGESGQLINDYLDSNYMGKSMREYYGIPKPVDSSKKKSSELAKRTRKPSSSAIK